MRRQGLWVIAVVLGLVGAGCSLPEVKPLIHCATPGPSPYGPWYEQHWSANAVMIAASADPCAPKLDLSYCNEATTEEFSGEPIDEMLPPEERPQEQTEEGQSAVEASQSTDEEQAEPSARTPEAPATTDASSTEHKGSIRY